MDKVLQEMRIPSGDSVFVLVTPNGLDFVVSLTKDVGKVKDHLFRMVVETVDPDDEERPNLIPS